MVAGGVIRSSYTSSVATLLPGATAWTPLVSLPGSFGYAQASIVGGNIRVTGGIEQSGSRISEVVTNDYSDAM